MADSERMYHQVITTQGRPATELPAWGKERMSSTKIFANKAWKIGGLIGFETTTCGPCRAASSIMQEFTKNFAEPVRISVHL